MNFKVYEKCFIGRDLISLLCIKSNYLEAIKKGNEMIESGEIIALTCKEMENKFQFYRFKQQEITFDTK